MNSPSLDIVLPCYNPIEGWSTTVVNVLRELQERLPLVYIYPIIVNDGSQSGIDASDITLIQEYFPQLTYLQNTQNMGKGYTLRKGVNAAQHELCIYTDIDFPYSLESLLSVYRELAEGKADIAVGIKDSAYYEHLPDSRVRISKGLRWLARNFLKISITDTQCGLKGFNRKGRNIFLATTINRYLCDLEFIYLADRKKEIVMNPVIVKLKEGVVFSHVNMNVLMSEGINFMKVVNKSRSDNH